VSPKIWDPLTCSIIFVTGVFLVLIVTAWFIYDSIFLRYIILFMGVGSSTYAIWDIITDGVIGYGKDDEDDPENRSDCEAMAIWYNSMNPVCTQLHCRP
jgi:hypothetical protein